MRRKLVIVLTLIFCICFGSGFASASVGKEETSPLVDGYYSWKVTSTTITGYSYGAWRNGPSGTGPANLKLSNSNATNISVTNTISGSYTNLGTIESAIGITIGKSITQSVSYEITIPAGAKRQIIYRPYFKAIKVVEKEYFVDHGVSSPTGKSKTSYVKAFVNWDYSWKSL